MPLLELARFIDGANINLKSFDDSIYQSLNGGTLQPVLNTFKTLHEEGVWFEMTTLVVPTYIDDQDMIKRMCGWILKELGPDYPLHFIRFHPDYKLTRLPSTPVATLESFRDIAMKEGIHYVYVGNVPGHEGEHTYCHNCKKLLIERNGYLLRQVNIEGGKCKFCGTSIPGRWA
jgi:pyruvate formate lyase activating enzyme